MSTPLFRYYTQNYSSTNATTRNWYKWNPEKMELYNDFVDDKVDYHFVIELEN